MILIIDLILIILTTLVIMNIAFRSVDILELIEKPDLLKFHASEHLINVISSHKSPLTRNIEFILQIGGPRQPAGGPPTLCPRGRTSAQLRGPEPLLVWADAPRLDQLSDRSLLEDAC
jgi:hypothetical protein